MAIEVYGKEVLMTLQEAAEKLQGSIKNINASVLMAKRNMSYSANGLTVDEAAAIYLYTIEHKKADRNVSFQLNRILRSTERSELITWLPYLQLLLNTLKKLPSMSGKIWRFAPGNLMDSYQTDCVWSGFSSCTKSLSVVKGLLNKSDVYTIFQIECVNGKEIQNYSSRPDEDEVLLLPSTYLRVKDKKRLKNGSYLVVLQERDSQHLHSTETFGFSSSMLEINRTDQGFTASEIQANNQPKYKRWLDCQFHQNSGKSIMTPKDLQTIMQDPPGNIDNAILNCVQGSMIGMALGDALGAHAEFRPRQYMMEHPVRDLEGGGTWGLAKGQFTDDTSMALCLANSLVSCGDFIPYDQLVRYKWWYRSGYMSSTGQCFDIGMATRQSLHEFERRQQRFAREHDISIRQIDFLSDPELLTIFKVDCSEDGVAGNGALMRLAPVPLFFHKYPSYAVEFSGISGIITHGDLKAYDACRYYGALIVAALRGETKEQLLSNSFYYNHATWFNNKLLVPEVMAIAKGSYKKKGGYNEGIRGKGYIVNALEAALWAFWCDENSFEIGALNAVNLGDDTDTTAAIYGQLAGAYYGYKNLPKKWVKHVYALSFIECLCKWIVYEGQMWQPKSHALNSLESKSRSNSDVLMAAQSKYISNSVPNMNQEFTQTPTNSENQLVSKLSRSSVKSAYSTTQDIYEKASTTQSNVRPKSIAKPVQISHNDMIRTDYYGAAGLGHNHVQSTHETNNGLYGRYHVRHTDQS
ncbi:unnamed protein product [Rotaria sp. Silwood2]|nr:unnamed protein product [Rotaria sp. Silwood2]